MSSQIKHLPILGLCCVVNELKQTGVALKTTTFKYNSKRVDPLLHIAELVNHNLETTLKYLTWCKANDVKAFRISSSMFPLMTYPPGKDINTLPLKDVRSKRLKDIQDFLITYPMHITMHPEHFTNIASERSSVVDGAILDLELHGWFMDQIGLPQSYAAPINIHINTQGDPIVIANRVMGVYKRLSKAVTTRLVFETEDKGIWNLDHLITHFTQPHGIPITFDFLHNACNPAVGSVESLVQRAFNTWRAHKVIPYAHYSESEPTSKNPRQHADYCVKFPPILSMPYWCDLESHAKEADLLQVRKRLMAEV